MTVPNPSELVRTRPSSSPPDDRAAITAAVFAAALSVAGHVLGKAVRDALFLAAFPISYLPYMLLATGLVSILAVSAYTRLNARFGPQAVIPIVGLATAFWLAPLWLGVRAGLHWALLGLYPWTTITGTLLASGFWAVMGERFDPRRARRLFGTIGVAATVGGLAGGLGAHAALHVVSTEDLVLVLAVIDLLIAGSVYALGRSVPDRTAPRTSAPPRGSSPPEARKPSGGIRSGFSEIWRTHYLRDIALLLTVGTVGGTIADYVLKDSASQALHGSRELAEFFSLFHGVVGAATLLVQVLIARPLLTRKGLAAGLSALPIWLAGSALAMALWPVLRVAAVLRGGESAGRNSFHRSAYELLFVPLGPMTKRLVKPILDTLVERLADGLGAGAILLAVGVLGLQASRLALVIGFLGAIQLWIVLRVKRGYVETLSLNLAARALELETVATAADDDATAREALRSTLLDIRSTKFREDVAKSQLRKSFMKSLQFDPELAAVLSLGRAAQIPAPSASKMKAADEEVVDLVQGLTDESLEAARAAISRWDGRERRIVPFLVRLLARDDLYMDVIRVLGRAGDRNVGTLSDHLDDQREPFVVRRRLPRALAECASPLAIAALTRALSDARFDVRFHAGAALEVIQSRTGQRPVDAPVWAAIRAEVVKSRQMWEAQRLLDAPSADDPLSGVVERGGAHSLRHVFRLLGLVLDAKAMELSYRAVRDQDSQFRGVGLEYLENVLPKDVKEALWPLIGDDDELPPLSRTGRSLAEVMKELAAKRE